MYQIVVMYYVLREDVIHMPAINIRTAKDRLFVFVSFYNQRCANCIGPPFKYFSQSLLFYHFNYRGVIFHIKTPSIIDAQTFCLLWKSHVSHGINIVFL